MRISSLGTALLLLVACGNPVEGDWISDKKLANGEKNEMSLYGDNTGTADIFATPESDPSAWVKFEFEIEWEDKTDEFELDMSCEDGPCGSADFTMECEVIAPDDEDIDKLDCKADRNWSTYPFDWERDTGG